MVATWNVGEERMKGYRIDEIVGEHFSRFYPEADVRAGKCEMELDVAAREGRFEDEGWRIRKDGVRFWANVIITALRNASGDLIGFAKVTHVQLMPVAILLCYATLWRIAWAPGAERPLAADCAGAQGALV